MTAMSTQTPAAIFLHPVALDGRASAWLDVPGLITPTQLGHGQRQQPGGRFSLDDLADEVTGWTSGPVHLIGCSMGGMVALRFALRHPERVASLVLGYTTARVGREGMLERAARTDELGAKGMASATMERWFTREALARQPLDPPVAYALERLTDTPTQVISDTWRAIADHDVLGRLGELAGIPTTCVAGRRDLSTPLAAMEATGAAIPGAELVVTDHPHMGFLEDPRGFSAVVARHLDRAGSVA
jgi:3-oxoadipate enol-lactonase